MGSREDAIKKMNEAIVREVRMNEDPLHQKCLQTGALIAPSGDEEE